MHDRISDEMLMAYADGELDGPERRKIDVALARDAGLRSRLGVFERTGAMLARAFDAPLHTGAERGLPAALARPLSGSGWVDRLKAALTPAPAYGLAGAAAALMLVIGAVATLNGPLVTPEDTKLVQSQGSRILAGGALRSALDRQESTGLSQASAALAVIQTFHARDGRYCREYALAEGGSRGIACRETDGGWAIAVHLASRTGNQTGTFAPAGAQDQMIDGYLHQIMEGDPLTVEAEKSAIASGWRR